MISLQEILKDPPNLHRNSSGNLTSWQISDEVLDCIDRQVSDNSHTLETGAGISTILFAIKASHHTCIVPDQQQVNRIKEYCNQHQISTKKIDFKIDISENILPHLEINKLDCILIDGSHAFPIPFIDWYYTCQKLKVGGKLIIDDTQIWTGEVLKKFLMSEPEWQFQQESPPRSAIFTKVQEYINTKGFQEQLYTVNNSRIPILLAELKIAIGRLLNSDFSGLSYGLLRRLRRLNPINQKK